MIGHQSTDATPRVIKQSELNCRQATTMDVTLKFTVPTSELTSPTAMHIIYETWSFALKSWAYTTTL